MNAGKCRVILEGLEKIESSWCPAREILIIQHSLDFFCGLQRGSGLEIYSRLVISTTRAR
jgi:hypothetical protein